MKNNRKTRAMSDKEDIKSRMQELSAFIDEANTQVSGGQMVDLQGLDDEVASLCERTLALPPQDAVEVQPLMADMITKLEDLGRSLQIFQDKLEQQKSEQ